MRRVHLRGHANIRKRLLIHAGAFNLGLLMCTMIGVGTPRGLQGRAVAFIAALLALIRIVWPQMTRAVTAHRLVRMHTPVPSDH